MELTLNLDKIAMKQLRGAMAEFTNDVVAERRMIGAMKKRFTWSKAGSRHSIRRMSSSVSKTKKSEINRRDIISTT